MTIQTISVTFSSAAVFGDVDPASERIDETASLTNYADGLHAALADHYPGAQVTVTSGLGDHVSVNGWADHAEVPWVEQILERHWSAWTWLVHLDAA